MTDTTDLIQRLRTDVLWYRRRGNETIAEDCRQAADALEQQARELNDAINEFTAANAEIEQQAAQIAEKDAEIARLHKALDSAYAQAMENGATANALRADAERMRGALNFIAEHMCSDWSQRCQAMVNTARAALRQEQPTKGEGNAN